MVGPPFRCTSMSYFLQVLLKLSLSPWWYGAVICGFLVPVVMGIGVPGVVIFLLGDWCLAPHLHPVEGPCWVLAFLQAVI